MMKYGTSGIIIYLPKSTGAFTITGTVRPNGTNVRTIG